MNKICPYCGREILVSVDKKDIMVMVKKCNNCRVFWGFNKSVWTMRDKFSGTNYLWSKVPEGSLLVR